MRDVLLLFEHVLFAKPVPTLAGHALEIVIADEPIIHGM